MSLSKIFTKSNVSPFNFTPGFHRIAKVWYWAIDMICLENCHNVGMLLIWKVGVTRVNCCSVPRCGGRCHRWSSDVGISRLGHPKMAEAFPGKQLRGRISPCIGNRYSPYLDHMACIWVGMDDDNRIRQKRTILCKREGNKSRRDAGFSPSRFCHDAGSSIHGCR